MHPWIFGGVGTLKALPTHRANLSNAYLYGVNWDDTTCPDGTNSDNNGNTCVNNL